MSTEASSHTNTTQHECYPLTQNQQAIWLDEVVYGASSMYNIGLRYSIIGVLEPARLVAAIEQVVASSENFGIRLHLDSQDEVVQIFVPSGGYQTPVIDFSGEQDALARCLSWMDDRFELPFELYDRPLYDFAILRVSADHFSCLRKRTT